MQTGTATYQAQLFGDWGAEALLALGEGLVRACDAALSVHAPSWMGHCKVLLDTEDWSAYVSLTGAGEAVRWRGAVGAATTCQVTIYCVAAGVDDRMAEEAIERARQRYLEA